MSDYPNPNLHRSDGVSGRGLLIALGVIVAIIALLAVVGTSTAPTGDGAVSQDAIAPATDSVVVPTE
ncbi:MAG: hypothetical protein AAFQ19_06205 [Pseudomonadota bacterium]